MDEKENVLNIIEHFPVLFKPTKKTNRKMTIYDYILGHIKFTNRFLKEFLPWYFFYSNVLPPVFPSFRIEEFSHGQSRWC